MLIHTTPTNKEGRTGVDDTTQKHIGFNEMSKLWKEQTPFALLPCPHSISQIILNVISDANKVK